MTGEAPRTAIQQLQWDEHRLLGMQSTLIAMRDRFTDDELHVLLCNINVALKRIQNLRAQPKPRIAKSWSKAK